MAIFKRKSTLEADLASMRKRVEALAAKRADAKSSFDIAISERQRHLLEGDLSDEKAGELNSPLSAFHRGGTITPQVKCGV